jgi:CheY-like chemotaxis protein
MPSEVTRPLVLIADPDVECTALMARQLEWAGYGVLTTGFDADAIELIEERRPDALILEATLPEMSGYSLARHLRSQPHNRLLPILMVSARAGKLDRDFAFTSGADDYVKKPFRCADIVSKLGYLVPARPTPMGPRVRRPVRPLAEPALALR